jgi:diguanylate cyclase (GGDEF)-like protein/PAS domain S-box-containing protein
MDREKTRRAKSKFGGSDAPVLEHRLRIADTVSAISVHPARFDDLEAFFHIALAEMGVLVGADHAYVFQFRDGKALLVNTHEWCAAGITSQTAKLQELRPENFAWFMQNLDRGKPFQISEVNALPAEAEAERLALLSHGIQSLMVMPLGPAGHQLGFVAFDNFRAAAKWPPKNFDLLQIVPQLMGDSLARPRPGDSAEQLAQQQNALRESEELYRNLMEFLPAIVYRYSQHRGASYWSPQVEDFLGFSQQDLLADPFLWHNAIHPHDLPVVDAAIQAFEVGKEIDLDYRIRDTDGKWHWFHDRSIRRLDEDGETVIEGLAYDITASRSSEQELMESEQRYRGVVEDTPLLICRFLPGGEITFVNEAYCRYFEKSTEELIGSSFLELVPEDDRDVVIDNINALTAVSPNQSHDHRVFLSDGTVRWQRWTNRALFDVEGNAVAYQSIGDDITERKRAEELIEHQATYDALTELPNRRLLLDRLTQALARCRRHGHKGALLFLDLDQFKHINDSLGHPVGDELLKETSKRMTKGLREEDTAARMGGDEFVVLLSEIGDDAEKTAQQSREVAEKLRNQISVPCIIRNNELHITASIGIATFPMGAEDANDVMRHADTAMYRAKEAGRNTIRFFLPSMQHAAEQRLRLQNELRLALTRNEWELHFQPQVDASGTTVGAEALLRWRHPERGLIAPAEFIPVAEETGQILLIGEWVLERSLSRLKTWTNDIANSTLSRLAINVSPRQFHQTDFLLRIESILSETGADPGRLTLELTEGVIIDNLDDTIRKMDALKRLGMRLSIDDFGIGYSSLAYLKQLPLDEVKIDRSFVSDVTTDPSDANLVKTIITMADHLGLDVVAEGVETEEQLRFLLEQGCGLFQGYYFNRPQSAEDFEKLLRKSAMYSMAPFNVR